MSFNIKEGDKLPSSHKKLITLGIANKHATRRNKAKGVTLPKLPPFKEEDATKDVK